MACIVELSSILELEEEDVSMGSGFTGPGSGLIFWGEGGQGVWFVC